MPKTKGIYLTAYASGNKKVLQKIDTYIKSGINTVVFDIKDVGGEISYNSNLGIVKKFNLNKNYPIDDMNKFVDELKKRNIYTIARIACFRDHLLAKCATNLAIQNANGSLWNSNSKELWLDPTNKFTQEYLINLAIEVASFGVDEIQFDYIRFPTSGPLSDAHYAYSFGKMKRENSIALFLKRIYLEMKKRNVNVSIDVFGVVAWGVQNDIDKTGQRLSLLALYCDAISPMLYPSHFNDHFDGFANPGDNPTHFIGKGVNLVKQEIGNKAVRPWLQAFGWRVDNYNKKYILDQIDASDKNNANGYLFWNASSNYDKVKEALHERK